MFFHQVSLLIEEQKKLEEQYEQVMSNQEIGIKQQESEAATLAKAIHQNTQAINKSFRKNKSVQDNGQKIQADRKFLHDVLSNTLLEIQERQTFETLVDAVNSEKQSKTELVEIVRREEESRKKVKQLQRALVDVRKEREVHVIYISLYCSISVRL